MALERELRIRISWMVEDPSAKISPVFSKIGSLSGNIDALSQKIDRLLTQIGQIGGSMSTGLQAVTSQVQQLNTALGQSTNLVGQVSQVARTAQSRAVQAVQQATGAAQQVGGGPGVMGGTMGTPSGGTLPNFGPALQQINQYQDAIRNLNLDLQRASFFRQGGDIESSLRIQATAVRNFREEGYKAGQTFQQVNQDINATKTAVGGLGSSFQILGQHIDPVRLIAWAVGWTLVYRAINLVMEGIAALTIGAIREFAEFEKATIRLATEIRMLDPSVSFAQAEKVAKGSLQAVREMRSGFQGTEEQLRVVLTAGTRFFGELDVSSVQARRNFEAFANAVVQARPGMESTGRAFLEIGRLVMGTGTTGGTRSQLLYELQKRDPDIRQHIALWQQEGTVIENIVKLLPAYAEEVDRLNNSLSGQFSQLAANIKHVLKDIGESESGLIVGVLKNVNSLLQGKFFGEIPKPSATESRVLEFLGINPEEAQKQVNRFSDFLNRTVKGTGTRLLHPFSFAIESDDAAKQTAHLAKLTEYVNSVGNAFTLSGVSAKLFFDQFVDVKGVFTKDIDPSVFLAAAQDAFERGEIGLDSYARAARIAADETRGALDIAIQSREPQAIDKATKALIQMEKAAATTEKQLRDLVKSFEAEALSATLGRITAQFSATHSDSEKINLTVREREVIQKRLAELYAVQSELQHRDRENSAEFLKNTQEINNHERQLIANVAKERDLRIEVNNAIRQSQSKEFQAIGRVTAGRLVGLDVDFEAQVRAAEGNQARIDQLTRTHAAERAKIIQEGQISAEKTIGGATGNTLIANLLELEFKYKNLFAEIQGNSSQTARARIAYEREVTEEIKKNLSEQLTKYLDLYNKLADLEQKVVDARLGASKVQKEIATELADARLQSEQRALAAIPGGASPAQLQSSGLRQSQLEQQAFNARKAILEDEIRGIESKGHISEADKAREIQKLQELARLYIQYAGTVETTSERIRQALNQALVHSLDVGIRRIDDTIARMQKLAGFGAFATQPFLPAVETQRLETRRAGLEAEKEGRGETNEERQQRISDLQTYLGLLNRQRVLQGEIQVAGLPVGPITQEINLVRAQIEGLQKAEQKPVTFGDTLAQAAAQVAPILGKIQNLFKEVGDQADQMFRLETAKGELDRIAAYIQGPFLAEIAKAMGMAGSFGAKAFVDTFLESLQRLHIPIPGVSLGNGALQRQRAGERELPNPEHRAMGGPITYSGLYQLHKGEFVLPPWLVSIFGGIDRFRQFVGDRTKLPILRNILLQAGIINPTTPQEQVSALLGVLPGPGIVGEVGELASTLTRQESRFAKTIPTFSQAKVYEMTSEQFSRKFANIAKSFEDIYEGKPVTLQAYHGTSSGAAEQIRQMGFTIPEYERNPLNLKTQAKLGREGLLGRGIYFTDSPHTAGQYGTPFRIEVKLKNPLVISQGSMSEFSHLNIEELQSLGYDGIIVQSGKSSAMGASESYRQGVAFDPKSVRMLQAKELPTRPVTFTSGAIIKNPQTGELGEIRRIHDLTEYAKAFWKERGEEFDAFLEVRWKGTKENPARTELNVKDKNVIILGGHRDIVERALQAHKDVPIEILKEYPDLTIRYRPDLASKILPSRETGGSIPQTGPYQLHQGEHVLPAWLVQSLGGQERITQFMKMLRELPGNTLQSLSNAWEKEQTVGAHGRPEPRALLPLILQMALGTRADPIVRALNLVSPPLGDMTSAGMMSGGIMGIGATLSTRVAEANPGLFKWVMDRAGHIIFGHAGQYHEELGTQFGRLAGGTIENGRVNVLRDLTPARSREMVQQSMEAIRREVAQAWIEHGKDFFMPSRAAGGTIPQTGPVLMHEGEGVLPKAVMDLLNRTQGSDRVLTTLLLILTKLTEIGQNLLKGGLGGERNKYSDDYLSSFSKGTYEALTGRERPETSAAGGGPSGYIEAGGKKQSLEELLGPNNYIIGPDGKKHTLEELLAPQGGTGTGSIGMMAPLPRGDYWNPQDLRKFGTPSGYDEIFTPRFAPGFKPALPGITQGVPINVPSGGGGGGNVVYNINGVNVTDLLSAQAQSEIAQVVKQNTASTVLSPEAERFAERRVETGYNIPI